MENASKALIIAGAILIAILLITIGIILINSGRDITDTGVAGMQSQKIQTFNAQFIPYEGTKKGAEIRSIVNTVNASNATDAQHKVKISGVGTLNDLVSKLVSTKQYKVELVYATADGTDTEKGYICEIKVTDTTATPVVEPQE